MTQQKEYKATMVGLHKYLTEKIDIQKTAVFKHHNNALCLVPKEAKKYLSGGRNNR